MSIKKNKEHTTIPPHLVLTTRLEAIWKILDHNQPNKPEEMYCFIMYDIENNKVRNRIAKYLKKSGCMRIQKSIFVGRITTKQYDTIYSKFKQIQELYDNHDSIIFSPILEDSLTNLKCIGQNFEYEMITKRKNLIFV